MRGNSGKKEGSVRMGKKKISLARLLIVSMLCIVLLQGLLLLSTLMSSGARRTMENNAVEIDGNIVENRRVVLENVMVNRWNSVRNESTYLGEMLAEFLLLEQIGMEDFLSDAQIQRSYIRAVYPELMDNLRHNTTCGIFLVLANDSALTDAAEYQGFFLRDSDPETKNDTNSDILLERGDQQIARDKSIAMDSSWSPSFSFAGEGVRAADDFFYVPYRMAQRNTQTDPSELGYWSMPFVLEDHLLDSHSMITYSVPLVYGGYVYGVIGMEVSVSYLLNSYFFLRDFDRNLNAGYAIAIKGSDGGYLQIVGKGALYDAVGGKNAVFTLDTTDHQGLLQVSDAQIGTQNIYAVTSEMKLYANNISYPDRTWVVCGFVTEESIFGMGNSLYQSLITTVIVCAAVGMVVMTVIVRMTMRPFYRLMDSVRGGIRGLKSFRATFIQEIEELHGVIEVLTENEIGTAAQLREEKERYRIALESSNDIFFTYREREQTIEIVNSHDEDGVWPIEEIMQRFVTSFRPVDQESLAQIFAQRDDQLHEELFFRSENQPEGRWFSLNAKTVGEDEQGNRIVVGYLRDIQEIKKRALEREQKQLRDSATGLYTYKNGCKIVEATRDTRPNGMLLLFDVCNFGFITRTNGIVFGDALLHEFSKAIQKRCEARSQDIIALRAGADEFLIWIPGDRKCDYQELVHTLWDDFASLVRPSALNLNFRATCAVGGEYETTEVLIARVRAALAYAKKNGENCMPWAAVPEDAPEGAPFGEIVSQGIVGQLGFVPLAMNLYDRSGTLEAPTDLLAHMLTSRIPLKNLAITDFQEEFFSGTVLYEWKPIPEMRGQRVFRATQEQIQQLNHLAQHETILPIRNLPVASRIFAPDTRGIAVPMSDNGSYIGSIFFFGVPDEAMQDEDTRTLLLELSAVMQNRINQQRHDQSAKAKSDFLARMSHEIRTPMNGIIGMTDIALRPNQSEQSRRECLENVRSCSNYLLGLLNDILDMSKIESGKMTICIAPFDMHRLLEELHPVLDAKFAEKQQQFVTDVHLSSEWYLGDALRISQVLINLLGNAVKYSPEQTQILLTVREVEDGIFFSVRDQGIGICEEDRTRIFRQFEQIDTTDARQQGTGLGLPISNRLVRLMGGEIHLDSELGKGSTFSFTLHLSHTADPSYGKRTRRKRHDFRGVNVLVAEDNELNMQILRFFLEEFGCTVTPVSDGEQALEAFRTSTEGMFALVILDVMMPVMNGLEAANAIRSLERADSKSVPILALSANAFDEDIRHSLASGCNAHLSKPVDQKKLAETLAQLLGE